MKKFLAVVLVMLTAIGLFAGCGEQVGKIVMEDMDKVPEDTYEIQWYLMGDAQNDVESVEKEINKYLKDKINATVKINILPSAQYQQKVGTMINANEYFDLCFVARWMLDYTNNARVGAFFPLDDYLDTYLKGIADEFDPEILDCSRVDGKLYALPVNKEMAVSMGWIYRKDIADKYNLDMSQYKTFESLEPVLKMLKEKEPSLKYPIDWASDSAPFAWYKKEMNVHKEGTYPEDQMVADIYQPEFEEACMLARDYYNKGYVRPDVLTATDHIQRMENGNTFIMWSPLKPGKAIETFKNSQYKFEQIDVHAPMVDYLAGTGSMQAVSASSKNPVRTMRFLNLLNTDPYLKNLVIHGVEGKHYKKIDELYVEPIKGSGYDMYGNTWAIGNVFLDYLIPGEQADKNSALKEFNASATNNAVNKFMLKEDPERDRIAMECSKVTQKYYKSLVMGVIDPKKGIKEYREGLEKVGYKENFELTKKEYAEYLKTLK